MPSNEETVRTGHSACSTSSAVSTIDQLTDEDMTKYTVKVGIVDIDMYFIYCRYCGYCRYCIYCRHCIFLADIIDIDDIL